MDTNSKPIIELADPPAVKRGRPTGPIQRYIETLRQDHPGQWACYARGLKHGSYFYTLRKHHSDVSIRTHRIDGKVDVYIKVDPQS